MSELYTNAATGVPDTFHAVDHYWLLDQLQIAIVVFNAQSRRITDVNRAYKLLFKSQSTQLDELLNLFDKDSAAAVVRYLDMENQADGRDELRLTVQYTAQNTATRSFKLRVMQTPQTSSQACFIALIEDASVAAHVFPRLNDIRKDQLMSCNMLDFTFSIDREGRILWINKVLPGFSQADVVGTSVFAYLERHRRTDMHSAIERIFSGATDQALELLGIGLPEESRYFVIHMTPIRFAGQIVEVLCIAKDVTEYKRIEASLRASQLDLQSRHRSLQTINNIANSVHTSFDESVIAKRVVDAMMGYSGNSAVGFYLLDARKESMRLVGFGGFSAQEVAVGAHLPVEGSLSGVAIKTGEVIVCGNFREDTRMLPYIRQALLDLGYLCGIVIPLTHNEEVMGTLHLGLKHFREFTATELSTFHAIGQSVGLALSNARHVARLEKETRERAFFENAIHYIASGISSATGDAFFKRFVQHLASMFNAQAAFVGMLTADNAQRVEILALCVDGEIKSNFSYQLPGRACETVIGSALRVYSNNVKEKFPDDEMLKALDAQSYIGAPLFDSSANPLGLLAVIDEKPLENISPLKSILKIYAVRAAAELERIRSDQALRRSEEHLRLALRAGRAGAWEWNIKTNEMLWSDAIENIFSGMPGETRNNLDEYISIVYADDVDSVRQCIAEVLEEQKPFFTEHRILRSDGKIRWLQMQGEVYRNMDCVPVRMRGTIQDITRQKQWEAELNGYRNNLEAIVADRTRELMRVNKDLEAFSYSVSHDLRAPLRTIDGFSLALQEDYQLVFDEKAQDYIQRVRHAAQRMAQLIDDILKLSRVTRLELLNEKLDLTAIAQAVIEDLRYTDVNRQVAVNIHSELYAHGDPRLFTVLLENLLGNAWKYTQRNQNANIEFGTMLVNGDTAYFVRDNGVGFDMRYAHKLFGAFQRLHSLEDFEGSGIGLATVARIIDRHNGKIWADAEKDKGATFYFTVG